jgi:hypothetical protein
MAQTYRQRFLGVLRQNEQDMTILLGTLAQQIRGAISAETVGDIVPVERLQAVNNTIRQATDMLFLGSGREPFTTTYGMVLPTSSYTRVLWGHIQAAARIGVERHQSIMERRLTPELAFRFRRATQNPFAAARVTSEQTDWRPRPFAAYDPPHLWVDPNGYRLSDRIWRTSTHTRAQIDRIVTEGISQGKSAVQIANEVERFLNPTRQGVRTRRPYGRNLSYDAMRLSRTEIARAHGQADIMAANLNPFVEGVECVLSASHPKYDICDEYAEGGPYPKDAAPALPAHPHCLCYYRFIMVSNPAAVNEDLRRPGIRIMDFVGPLLVGQFVNMLLSEPQGVFA